MRFPWFLLPFVTLPFLAMYLDLWRFLANRKAAMTFDVAPAQLTEAVTLLLLLLSFAITTGCLIRRGWRHYATSTIYCIVGLAVLLHRPIALMLQSADTSMGLRVSEYLKAKPFDNLSAVAWALLFGLGVILLIVDLLPARQPSTGKENPVHLY